jgi:hypothetical protein
VYLKSKSNTGLTVADFALSCQHMEMCIVMISDTDVLMYLQPQSALVRSEGCTTLYQLDARDALLDALGSRDRNIVVSEHWVQRRIALYAESRRGGLGFDTEAFVLNGDCFLATCKLTPDAMEWLDPLLDCVRTRAITPEADWVLQDAADGIYQWRSCSVTLVADWRQGVVTRLAAFFAPSEEQIAAWMFREQLQGEPTTVLDVAACLPSLTPC